MPKLVFTSAALSSVCVVIMAEAAFFDDYNSIGENFQAMKFSGGHRQHHQASNYFDPFGDDDDALAAKSNIQMSVSGRHRSLFGRGSGRRRGPNHGAGRASGNGDSKSDKASKKKSSKKKDDDDDDDTTTTETNIINFGKEKKKADEVEGKNMVNRLNENLAFMFGGTNGLEFDLCENCGKLVTREKTKSSRKKTEKVECDHCN